MRAGNDWEAHIVIQRRRPKMRPLSTEEMTEEIRATHGRMNVSEPQQKSPSLLLLVFLIVVEIGGMAVLCYSSYTALPKSISPWEWRKSPASL